MCNKKYYKYKLKINPNILDCKGYDDHWKPYSLWRIKTMQVMELY